MTSTCDANTQARKALPALLGLRDAVLVFAVHSTLLAFCDPQPARDIPTLAPPEITMKQPYVRDEASTAYALRLITDIDVTAEEVETWTDAQIRAAENWAAAVHMKKKLPTVKANVPPMPKFLRRYAQEVTA